MTNKINIHNTYVGDGFFCGHAQKILKLIDKIIDESKEGFTNEDIEQLMKLYTLISMFNNAFIYIEFEWMYEMNILKVLTCDDALKAIKKNIINVYETIESEK